jgi:hypothetical protein
MAPTWMGQLQFCVRYSVPAGNAQRFRPGDSIRDSRGVGSAGWGEFSLSDGAGKPKKRVSSVEPDLASGERELPV